MDKVSRGEPSWPRVLHTTVTLWWERRERRDRHVRPVHWPRILLTTVMLLWERRDRRGRAVRWRWLRVAALVLVVALAAVAGVALARDRTPGHSRARPVNPVLTAQAVRAQAASWVAGQVSRAAIVSCDPVMCSVLQAHGFPASNLDVLGPDAPDPLDSNLVVVTNVLRSQFGARLASVYAPVVLASFGTGSAAVRVRAVAPDGARAYLSQLTADVAARKSFGAQLVRDPDVAASPAARHRLELGQVDARLISVIATMAALHPLRILSFGDAAPGASPGVPLRSAVLASGTSGNASAKALNSLRSFLTAQRPPYLPAATQIVRLAAGQAALSIRFAAPDPLGLLSAGSAR